LPEALSGAVVTGPTGLTPGHCSLLPVRSGLGGEARGEGERWALFYHGRDCRPGAAPHDRVLMMDELRWGVDGWPFIAHDCPSTTSQPAP
jgi:hypothetical protein